jgi:cysteine desulfurase family protein
MIYLDNAATSYPKPPIVIEAMTRATQKCGNPGRSGHPLSILGGTTMIECRNRLCELLNTDDETRYIFTLNCTDALNMAIKGMLVHGGHVVTTALEHNSVLRPLNMMQQNHTITYSIVLPSNDGFIHASDVMSSVNNATRLVIINHASNVTGAIQPIKRIIEECHSKNIPVLVDGAQSIGKIKIDLTSLGVDLYAFPGHKGLLGPMGCGVLYVSPNVKLASYRTGGTGSESLFLSQPVDYPDHLEAGTPPLSAIAGLAAGIYIVKNNIDEIQQHNEYITSFLYDTIMDFNNIKMYSKKNYNAGVISFNIGDIPSYILADELTNYNIACRAGYHCAPLCHKNLGTIERGALRLSPGIITTKEDILSTRDALNKIIKSFV